MRLGSIAAHSPRRPLAPYVIVFIVVVAALIGIDALAISIKNPGQFLSDHQYLAIGDSIGFGYQPNLVFGDGYADDVFRANKQNNIAALVNLSCPKESSTTMINGDCPDRALRHTQYTGSQLDAAVNFLKSHQGTVNPITFDIGANDLFQDFNQDTCAVNTAQAEADIATLDTNLTKTILPQLTKAYTTPTGARAGVLLMLNYYDPFAKDCPGSLPFIQELNAHISADAAAFKIPIVDVYAAFGGDHMAQNICTYTWMCDARYHDVHPTTTGYSVIAQAVERVLNPPNAGPPANPLNPAPGIAPAPVQTPQGDLARRRV